MEYLTPDGLTHLVEFGDRLAGRTPAAPATVPSAQPRKYYELTSSPEFINAPHEVKKQMFDQWRATDMAAMLSHPSITDKARMQQEARAMQLFAAEHPAPDNSFFRKPADWGTAFLSGAVSGTGSVIAGVGRAAEIAGFDEAGQSMRDAAIATQEFAQKVEDTLGSDTLKDTRKMEQYRLAQADGQWEEGGATLRNFFASPVLTLSGLLGQITPIALGMLVNPVVGGAVAGTMGVGGANQGSYQSNVQYLTQLNQQDNLGWTDDQIKQIATDAVNGGISASDAVGLLAGVVEMIPVGRAMKSLGFGKKAVNAALTPGVRAAGNAVKKKVANNPSWQNAAREAAEKLVERPNATGEVPGYFSSGAFKYTARELGIDMGAGAVSGALEAVATNLGRIDPEAKFYDDMIPNIVTEMIMSSGFGSVNAISTTGQYRKEFSDHYSQLAAAKGLIDSMVEEGVSPAEIGVPPEDLFGPPPEFVGPQQPFVGPQQPTGGTSGQPTANTGVNPPTGSSASVPPAGPASAGGNQATTDPATNETATVPTAENPQANQIQSERPVAPENVASEAPTSDNTAVSDRQQGAQQQPSDSGPATTGAAEDTSQRGVDTQGTERTGGDGQQTADRTNKASLPRTETIDRWVSAETTDSGKVGPDGRDAASYVVHPDLREEAKAVWAEISNAPKYTDRAVRDPVTPKQFASAVAEEIMLRRLADDDAKEGDNLAERARALLGTRGKLQGKVGRARRDLEALSQDYLSGEIGELELLNQAFDVLNRADKEFTARGIDASQYDTGRAEQEAADNVAKVKEREEEDAALRQVQAAATESEVDAAKAKKATNGRKQTTKKSAKKSALKKTNAPVAETVAEPVAEVAPAKKSATKKASAKKSALKEPTAKKAAAKKTAAKKAATKQAADTRETSKELMEQLIEATADTDLADLDHFIRLAWQRAGTEQKRLRLLSALTRTETFDDAADVLHPLLSDNASRTLSLMVGHRIESVEELMESYVENIEATGRDLEDQFNDEILARENAEDIIDVGDADDYSYDYDDISADIDGYGYDDSMDDGRYMRRQGRRSGVSVAEVESIVDDMTADWENKLDTLIHASIEADSVPKVIREYNRDLMAEGATPAVAVLYRGKMHIFADQVESTDEVVQAVLHETIGHHGLRNVFGNALSTILDGFVETNPSQVIRKAKQYGLVPPNLTGLSDAELASRMSKENLRIAAEEVIAEYAESNPRHHTVRRLVASIKQWLRSKFPGLFNTLSDNDIIAQFIIPAQGWVKRGQTTNQGVINVPLFRREDWRDEVDGIRSELNTRSRQYRVEDRQRAKQEAAQRAEERRLAQERRAAEEQKEAQAEGFGGPVQLTIDGHKITAWDAIRSDSEAAAEIRFKRKANSTGAKVAHNLFKFNKRRPVVTQDEVLRLSKGETFELSRTPSQWLDDALSYIRRKVVDEMDDLKKLSPELHRTFERGIARRNAILAEESKKLDAYAKALSKGVAVLRRRGIRMTEDELSQAAGYYTTAKYAAEANIARYKSWTKEHADNVKEMDALYDEHPQLVVDDERVMGIDDLTGSQRRVVDATIDADASTMPWDQVVEIVRRRSNKVTKTARKRLNEIKERQKYLDDVIAGHERIDHQALSTNELYEALGITEQQAKEEDADTLTEAIDTLTGDTAESPDLKTRYRPIGGMTTGFANQVVSTYESGDMAAVVKDLRNHILAIEKATTKLGDEHGIYTDHHRMGRDGLASYVPTTGDPTRYRAATMMDDATLQLEDWTGSTYGAGINSRAVYRHREGRATLPDSADKAVIDRLYAVVNQIGSKPLKDALAERVFTAADPELAEAFRNGTLTYKQANTILNSRAGYQSLLDQAGMVLVPAQFTTNEPGHEIHYELQVIGDDGVQTSIPVKIRFADAGISQALIGATSERANSILQFLGGITRFGQRMIVQVDAFFPIKSSFRDVFERINILSTRVLTDVDGKPVSVSLERDLPRLTAQVVKSIRALVRGHGRETSAVWQYAFNRTYTNNADGRLLKEFIDNGGVSTLANTLSSIRANPSKTLRRHSKWRKHVTKASDALTAWGEVFELNVSFNTYKMLRDKGMSEADAAFQVLDGMNFSRKGEWTNTLRPLYYFINPSIQGANNFVKGFKTNPMASVAGLIKWALLGSLAQGALGMIGGGDDDDDVLGNYYDRRPLGWRMRNIAFTIPGSEGSVTIPIAFGMSAVGWGFGQIVRDVTLGKLSAGDAAGELSSLLGAEMTGLPLSDVDFTENPVEWLFRTLLPSSFGGLADAATGKNRWGTEINRAFLQPDQFRHLQGKDNTEATYKAIAEWLHEASGVDMTPEEVKYFITGTLVGPLGRIIKGVETGVGGDPMNGFVTAVGLGAFYSDAPASTIETAYYTRIAEAQELQKELDKTLPKLPGQTETLDELMNRALAAGMSIEDASSIVLTTQVKRNLRGVDKDTRRLFMIEYLRRMNR